MGLYAIDCPACQKPHIWFSGNMDQRCEACRKPKEWWISALPDQTSACMAYITDPSGAVKSTWFHVIEKSAFDFQCKQVADLAKTYNDSFEHYNGIINNLREKLEIERAEVARLLAANKRARTRTKRLL